MENYRLRVADCANFVIGAGVNASLAFKDKFETKDLTSNVGVRFKNAVDMDFVLRAGFEIGSLHRMQVNATIIWSFTGESIVPSFPPKRETMYRG